MFKEFIEVAESEIEAIREKDSALQQEESRIRNRLNELSEIRSKFIIKDTALASYVSACASNPHTCPSCFISQNSTVTMRPITADYATDIEIDIFKCPHCALAIEVGL